MIRRMTTLLAAVIATVLGFATAAVADPAVYPPSVQGTGTEVKDVKVGSGSGLAETGFDNTLALAAIALLAVGIVLLVVSRRRSHS